MDIYPTFTIRLCILYTHGMSQLFSTLLCMHDTTVTSYCRSVLLQTKIFAIKTEVLLQAMLHKCCNCIVKQIEVAIFLKIN